LPEQFDLGFYPCHRFLTRPGDGDRPEARRGDLQPLCEFGEAGFHFMLRQDLPFPVQEPKPVQLGHEKVAAADALDLPRELPGFPPHQFHFLWGQGGNADRLPDRLGREDVSTTDPVQAPSLDPPPIGQGDTHTLDFTIALPGQPPGPLDLNAMPGTGGNDRIGHLFPDPGHVMGTLAVIVGTPSPPRVLGEAKSIVVKMKTWLARLIFKVYKCNT